MLAYILKRILISIPTLLLLVFATFVLMRAVPGGPFDTEKALPPAVKENLAQKYHLDAPAWVQFTDYLRNISKGDFGMSFRYMGSRTVSEIITETLPTSAILGILAMLIAVFWGLPAGVLSAYFQNRWVDRVLMVFAVSGGSLPTFLLASLLVFAFSLSLGWFPPALWENWQSAVLPVLALAFRPAGLIARLTRVTMIEVLQSDYIRTAKSKGLPTTKILFKHALKNAILPVVTLLGPMTAAILTGSFIVEVMFAIPGLGKHFVSAVLDRDYPLIVGVTLVYGVIVMTANLVVDCLYAWVDPRVRL